MWFLGLASDVQFERIGPSPMYSNPATVLYRCSSAGTSRGLSCLAAQVTSVTAFCIATSPSVVQHVTRWQKCAVHQRAALAVVQYVGNRAIFEAKVGSITNLRRAACTGTVNEVHREKCDPPTWTSSTVQYCSCDGQNRPTLLVSLCRGFAVQERGVGDNETRTITSRHTTAPKWSGEA